MRVIDSERVRIGLRLARPTCANYVHTQVVIK